MPRSLTKQLPLYNMFTFAQPGQTFQHTHATSSPPHATLLLSVDPTYRLPAAGPHSLGDSITRQKTSVSNLLEQTMSDV